MGVQFKVPFFGFCPGVTATVVLVVVVVIVGSTDEGHLCIVAVLYC